MIVVLCICMLFRMAVISNSAFTMFGMPTLTMLGVSRGSRFLTFGILPIQKPHSQTDQQEKNGEGQGNLLEKMACGGSNDQRNDQEEKTVEVIVTTR
jgi:hypothetical protein